MQVTTTPLCTPCSPQGMSSSTSSYSDLPVATGVQMRIAIGETGIESEVSATSPRSRSSDIHASRSRSASCDVVSSNDSPDEPGPSASEPEVLSDGEQNLSPGLLTSRN